MKKYFILITTFCLILTSCNSTPKEMAYGSDSCHFCSMTVVDKQHAAQFMTNKGRSYVFDASECMLNHLKEIDPSTVALYLVNDYNAPGKMIDATQATYLISKNIPSPMGEYLTAFASDEAALNAQLANKGELYTWAELKERFD